MKPLSTSDPMSRSGGILTTDSGGAVSGCSSGARKSLTRWLTNDGLVSAMSSPAGLNEDFNISSARELTIAEIARIVWEACGQDTEAFELEHLPSFSVDVQRRWPSVEKARKLLGWEARITVEEGVALTVRWLRERMGAGRDPIAAAG